MKTRKITVLFIILSILTSVFGSVNTYADNKTDYMDKLGVTKGIKVGKAYKFDTNTTIGKSSGTWTLNKIKVSNASKKGYKKLTFTATWKNKFSPTQRQVDQLWVYSIKNDPFSVGCYMYAVVDKYTGINLEKEKAGKKYDVTVTDDNEIVDRKTKYCSDGDRYLYFDSKWKVKVTVIFPENYDGLCIGFGTNNKKNCITADNEFFNGKKKFEKTSYWKSGKKYTRWLDISSIM